MAPLLEAGPFTATTDGSRSLFTAVRLCLEARNLTVLEGPSGAGKTTLLRRLTALDPDPAAGYQLDGITYAGPRLPWWRSQVTLLPQDAPAVPGTVDEDLRFPYGLRAAGDRRYDEHRAAELLDAVGLAGIPASRPTAQLSGGERHRLALVRGLLWDPPVLVADEPLAALDGTTADRCWQLLSEFAHRPGHAVLTTLHDKARAGRGDARLLLADGRLEIR